MLLERAVFYINSQILKILIQREGANSCLTHLFTTKGEKNIFAIFLLLVSLRRAFVWSGLYLKSSLSLSLSSSSSHHCALLSSLFSLYILSFQKSPKTFRNFVRPSSSVSVLNRRLFHFRNLETCEYFSDQMVDRRFSTIDLPH